MWGFETLGGLDVSIGGVDILLLLSSLDIFVKSILEPVTVVKIKTPYFRCLLSI